MIYTGKVMKPQFIKESDKDLTWRMKNIFWDEYAALDYVVALEKKYNGSNVSYYVSENQTYIPFIKFKDESDEAEFILKEINA